MRPKKPLSDEPRQCSKCYVLESDEHPFPPKWNQCKRCLQDYNTEYQRKRKGYKPRDEKLSPEQRKQNKSESNRRWRQNNPEQAKLSRRKQHEKEYSQNAEEIKKKNSEWEKRNPDWRREYNKKRREARIAALENKEDPTP